MYFHILLGLYAGAILTTSSYVCCDEEDTDFQSFRLHHDSNLFVDKSLLIQEIMAKTRDKATLISRPPKFGKTTNMKMLQKFLEIPRTDDEEENNKILFYGGVIKETIHLSPLAIAHDTNMMNQHFGKYPVVYLSFKSCGYSNVFHAMNSIIKRIKYFIAEHEYLNGVTNDVTKVKKYSLETLTKHIRRHYEKKVILLLDDFDSPLIGAYLTHGASSAEFARIRAFYIDFMEYNVLYNDNIKRAVITSTTPMFKRLFDLDVYSVLDEELSTYFGFVDEEVKSLLSNNIRKRKNVIDDKDDIMNYYRGYNIGGQIVYNPESILKCLSTFSSKDESRAIEPLDVYWENNDNLKIFNHLPMDVNIVGQLDHYVSHGVNNSITINKTFSYTSSWEQDLYAFLIHTGYLNAFVTNEKPNGFLECKCSVVNAPTKHVIQGKIVEWLNEKLKFHRSDQQELLKCLTQYKMHDFKELVKEVLHKAVTTGLYSEENECYIDVLERLITFPANYHYNRVGQRSDIIFVRKSGKGNEVGIIMAIQAAPRRDADTLSTTASRTLQQLSEMGYESKLKEKSCEMEYILKVSIAFCGDQVDIKSEMQKADEIKITSPTTRRRVEITELTTMFSSSTGHDIDSAKITIPAEKPFTTLATSASSESEESAQFKMFLKTKLPIISDLSIQELEKHLQASKQKQIIFKHFLKSKGIMKDFKQTIYSMWAAIIHPDIHVVRRSLGVTRPKDVVSDFPNNYRHIIEAVVEVVHQLHNDTGIMTLLNTVQEILQQSDVIPVTEISAGNKKMSVPPHVEVKLVTEKPSAAKKQVVGKIRSWIGKIKSAFSNGTRHFHHKLKALLKGSAVTPSKKDESSESSSGFSSESDSEY